MQFKETTWIRWKSWLVLLLLVVGTGAGCAKNPVTGKRQLALISESQEIAIGQESHPQILAEFGELEQPQLQAYVSQLGRQLAEDSERPDLPWTFTVVDSPVVNAFAVPGGFIYITRQILAHMNSEAELAGVLGHEIGHVTARHSVTQLSRAQLIGLGLGLGGAFSSTFRNWSQLAELGAGVLFLKYSRDAERQADQLGIRYMFQEAYDPRQMSEFFEVFEFMREESGGALPNWLSSHPAPPNRRQATAQLARELMAQDPERPLQVKREAHLRRLQGLIYGENPREGYEEEGWFWHPDLRFRLRVPGGWQVQNTRSSVVLGEPNRQAAIQLTLSPPNSSAEQQAQELSAKPGVRSEWVQRDRINGNPAVVGLFQVEQGDTPLAALAAWIDYRGNLYQLLAITPAQRFATYRSVMEEVLGSFQQVTDPRVLNVQPDRIALHTGRRGETLEQIATRLGNPRVAARDLMVLNRIDPQQRLRGGEIIKVIVSGR